MNEWKKIILVATLTFVWKISSVLNKKKATIGKPSRSLLHMKLLQSNATDSIWRNKPRSTYLEKLFLKLFNISY